MSEIITRLYWVLNGLLVVVYFAVEHLAVILLSASAALFIYTSPVEQRQAAVGSSLLAVLAALLAPLPVPLLLLAMAASAWATVLSEKYNPADQRWGIIRAISLYALAGLGYAAYRNFGLANLVTSDPMLAQGAGYLNTIIGIAMFIFPLSSIAMSMQGILAHPPAPGGSPEKLVTTIRTRGGK
jgi:hypothetical protein